MTKKVKRLSIKQLESCLQDLDDFDSPKIELEQYATPPHIAALMLNTIDLTYKDLENKFVADLGCGTGRLSIGSLICGAALVFGFDVDGEALRLGLQNVDDTFGPCDTNIESCVYQRCKNFNFIQADIASESCCNLWKPFAGMFDTVIMNPPFGTKKNPGLDMIFLERAIKLTTNVVYSLHKTSTRSYISNKCQQWGLIGKPIAQIRYNLEKTYKFHKRKSVDIDVDLWRIRRSTTSQEVA